MGIYACLEYSPSWTPVRIEVAVVTSILKSGISGQICNQLNFTVPKHVSIAGLSPFLACDANANPLSSRGFW